jgi:hypothetical protein
MLQEKSAFAIPSAPDILDARTMKQLSANRDVLERSILFGMKRATLKLFYLPQLSNLSLP